MEPDTTVEVDFAHLQECVDRHCWYCNDEPRPRGEVERFLGALVACPPLAELEAEAA